MLIKIFNTEQCKPAEPAAPSTKRQVWRDNDYLYSN